MLLIWFATGFLASFLTWWLATKITDSGIDKNLYLSEIILFIIGGFMMPLACTVLLIVFCMYVVCEYSSVVIWKRK